MLDNSLALGVGRALGRRLHRVTQLRLRQVRREFHVRRALVLGRLPRVVRHAVAALVLPMAAQREQRQLLLPAIDELAAHLGSDADELAHLVVGLLALHAEREGALQDEVDLLLLRMAVNAAATARLEQHQVQAETARRQIVAQALEALAGLVVELRGGYSGFHGA